ncbi:murein hydrolase activator EnvC family protein [Aliarcobacter thereius]|uniref:AmiB activator n=2 Tax=Aliarcobacter thereius TaxID=544718 RepID=A0A1C0B689_9BACT|nr:M23 family metallopeptidase [Aliarcobacter thereius]OCL90088.1 AmiB activator [Aliarcobacter thereius]OCL96312.1 AmiB activator [Aliarcobacter thereius LMG 24486]OCL98812.1 AmiB activator [Aliarcobacter thereius]QBF15725.1 zinc metallopeptidase, M23 family [Aliarcobacter thereius LMG 24486]TLS92492.1 peptidase M23 [Aliarcobacter thereius]
MTKIVFLIFTIFLSFLNASNIDKKIEQNQAQLSSNQKKEASANENMKILAKNIEEQNRDIATLEKDISNITKDINTHQGLLESSEKKLNQLQNDTKNLIIQKKQSEDEIVNIIIEEFSVSMALNLASKESLQEIIDNEIFSLLSDYSKEKIIKINENYNRLSKNTQQNQKEIDRLNSYIISREKKKNEFLYLKSTHTKSLANLQKEHNSYQNELKKVLDQQDGLNSILADLKILKQEELKKAEQQRLSEAKKAESLAQTKDSRNQEFAKSLDLDVRKIGSSTDGVKIVKYKGQKTIAPLKSFKVEKLFGTYYDPVYKIKLFNESIVLSAIEKDSKVFSVLNGKVVYAKKNAGILDNVVIVQHSNGLHTVYSHLDDIAPNIVVGKWIQKGSVVGRVNSNLTFQVTKNSAYIDPKDLFKI